MTWIQFVTACGTLLIDPSVALENEAVIAALKATKQSCDPQDDERVIEVLREQF